MMGSTKTHVNVACKGCAEREAHTHTHTHTHKLSWAYSPRVLQRLAARLDSWSSDTVDSTTTGTTLRCASNNFEYDSGFHPGVTSVYAGSTAAKHNALSSGNKSVTILPYSQPAWQDGFVCGARRPMAVVCVRVCACVYVCVCARARCVCVCVCVCVWWWWGGVGLSHAQFLFNARMPRTKREGRNA
jgi:hypothetical protein